MTTENYDDMCRHGEAGREAGQARVRQGSEWTLHTGWEGVLRGYRNHQHNFYLT